MVEPPRLFWVRGRWAGNWAAWASALALRSQAFSGLGFHSTVVVDEVVVLWLAITRALQTGH